MERNIKKLVVAIVVVVPVIWIGAVILFFVSPIFVVSFSPVCDPVNDRYKASFNDFALELMSNLRENSEETFPDPKCQAENWSIGKEKGAGWVLRWTEWCPAESNGYSYLESEFKSKVINDEALVAINRLKGRGILEPKRSSFCAFVEGTRGFFQ